VDDSVVVLNMYKEYWTEFPVKRAIRKILNDRAVPLEEDRSELLGVIGVGCGEAKKFIPIYRPLIIQLKYFDYYHYRDDKVLYSDNAVLVRDKSICQYWHDYVLVLEGDKLIKQPSKRHQHTCKGSELTIDHILPISRGGKTGDFLNAVTCCRYCNEIIKKNQAPEEAGLELIRQPKAPKRIKGDIARSFFVYNPKKKAHRVFIKLMGS
jgi:5-methylcytosine-specific restriction endonuclease McrA